MKKCVLCQSPKAATIYKNKFWSVVKCNHCGLVRTERKSKPQYEEYHRDEDYHKFEALFENIFTKRYFLVKDLFAKPGVMLDVGTATGVMPMIFKKRGWETWGVEVSKSGNLAKKKGVKVVRSTFESAKLPNNYFDLVIINHTLEHMENPVSVLKKVRQILKEGGVVLVDVPNFGGLRSEILKDRWPYLLPLEHDFHFTKESLGKVFQKAGFVKPSFESRSGIFDHANPLLEVWESLTTFKKRFFTNILNLPLDFVSTVINRGDAISVVGKKI